LGTFSVEFDSIPDPALTCNATTWPEWETFLSVKTIVGIALIVVGFLGLIYQGLTYTTHRRIADVGPIHAEKTEHRTIPLPPVLGAIALIGGIVVIASDRRA
jgi:uncharacterized membrane protein HdeD (DUF308 family)